MSLAVSQRISDRLVLPNGLVVLVTENLTADIIAARCFFAGGERVETLAKSGLTHLVASLLTRGTERYSSLEIAEQVESIGASLGTEASSDYFVLSLKTITSDFHEMLLLGSEILRSPRKFCDRLVFPVANLILKDGSPSNRSDRSRSDPLRLPTITSRN